MKVLVRFCQQWANYSPKTLDILDEDTVDTLQHKVSQKFRLESQKFILKLNKDGFNVRLCPTFPLTFYNFQEKSMILIEIIETATISQQSGEKRINQKYFEKLGLLGSVKETDDEESHHQNLTKSQNLSPENEDNDSKSRHFSVPFLNMDVLGSNLQRMITSCKNGKIQEVKSILEASNEDLINEYGKCGWNALHYAIFHRNEELAIFLINKGANLNAKTFDGWSPLQMSIYRNQQNIFNKIVSSTKVDLDLKTSRGTALHLACRLNKVGFVKALIEATCDCEAKNADGYMPVDLTSNQEIISLFRKKYERDLKKKNDSEAVSQVNFSNMADQKCPEKPPIVKGEMYKIGRFGFNLNKRFFMLNAEEGTLIRFKSRKDFPLKPKEILPLKDIELIRKTEKPWHVSKELFFFEIKYAGKRQTLACKSKSTLKLWIKNIYQAAIYTIQMDSFLSKLTKENLTENIPQLVQNCFTLSSSAAVELYDDPKDEDLLLNKNLLFLEESKPPKSPPKEVALSTKSTAEDIESSNKVNFKSFQLLKLLGSGAFGKVYLARKKSSNAIYALKVLRKKQIITRNQVKYAVSEAAILQKVKHPFIINLHHTFQTPLNLYMTLDYCPGKDMALHLANHGLFSREMAKFYISEVILAIEYLHSQDIIYRDMKPENILIDQEGHVKLADFGLSKTGVTGDRSTMSFCGSPVYLCPELLKNKGYSKMSDIYGIGLVLYEMLTGNPPFYSDEVQVMYRLIMSGKVYFPKDISKEAKSLLENLLQKSPEKRFTIKEIKEHEFFKGLDWNGVFNKEYQPPNVDCEILNPHKVDNHLNFVDEDYNETNYDHGRFPNYSFSAGSDEKSLENWNDC